MKAGDMVRFNGGSPMKVTRVWTIDRGPDVGRMKASATLFIDVQGYRGNGMTVTAAVEDFEVIL